MKMNILFAADGSKFTKKALGFLMAHEGLTAGECELVVVNVQALLPPRVKTMVGSKTVADYYRDEARKVLDPIERFLARHEVTFKTRALVGYAPDEIVMAAQQAKAGMIVMGTHGHGAVGRAIMGSVAQKVAVESKIPVLLVK
jgi:nucleotide-binding universal stress UspA family protein